MELRTTRLFDALLASLGPEEQKQLAKVLVREAERIGAMPPGAARARWVHQALEDAMGAFAAAQPEVLRQVRCGKGCAHCCRVWVGITRDEAELLAERVREGTAHPDRARMDLQSGWEDPGEFISKPADQRACIFLGPDGACTVYEDRPSICRALLVTSDPELCRGLEGAAPTSNVCHPYLEALVSAALSVDAEGDPPPAFGRPMAATVRAALGPAV